MFFRATPHSTHSPRRRRFLPGVIRLETRDLPATLIVGGGLVGQVVDLSVTKSGFAPLGDQTVFRSPLVGTANVGVNVLAPKPTTFTSFSMELFCDAAPTSGVKRAVAGTTGTGLAKDAGLPVRVQIVAGPGEVAGDPVRVDLNAMVTSQYVGSDNGGLERKVAYRIVYTSESGTATTLLDGLDTSSHVNTAHKTLAAQTANFMARIGGVFDISVRLEATNTTLAPLSTNAGSVPSISLAMTAKAVPPGVNPGVVSAPKFVSAAVVKDVGKKGKTTVLRFTFDRSIDPSHAEDRRNYVVYQVVVTHKGKKIIERLKPVVVITTHYDSQGHTVDLAFRGKGLFKSGAQFTLLAKGIATLGGAHLAGDGVHEGTDATGRVRG